jgi:hypothetical protein
VVGEVKKLEVPELMEHDQDVKECVRMVMVAESIKEVLRPSA